MSVQVQERWLGIGRWPGSASSQPSSPCCQLAAKPVMLEGPAVTVATHPGQRRGRHSGAACPHCRRPTGTAQAERRRGQASTARRAEYPKSSSEQWHRTAIGTLPPVDKQPPVHNQPLLCSTTTEGCPLVGSCKVPRGAVHCVYDKTQNCRRLPCASAGFVYVQTLSSHIDGNTWRQRHTCVALFATRPMMGSGGYRRIASHRTASVYGRCLTSSAVRSLHAHAVSRTTPRLHRFRTQQRQCDGGSMASNITRTDAQQIAITDRGFTRAFVYGIGIEDNCGARSVRHELNPSSAAVLCTSAQHLPPRASISITSFRSTSGYRASSATANVRAVDVVSYPAQRAAWRMAGILRTCPAHRRDRIDGRSTLPCAHAPLQGIQHRQTQSASAEDCRARA